MCYADLFILNEDGQIAEQYGLERPGGRGWPPPWPSSAPGPAGDRPVVTRLFAIEARFVGPCSQRCECREKQCSLCGPRWLLSRAQTAFRGTNGMTNMLRGTDYARSASGLVTGVVRSQVGDLPSLRALMDDVPSGVTLLSQNVEGNQ